MKIHDVTQFHRSAGLDVLQESDYGESLRAVAEAVELAMGF